MNRDEFDQWLDQGMEETPRAPAGFADRVMQQVRAEAPLDRRTRVFTSTISWWLRALAQPATILALLLAAILIAVGPHLLGRLQDAAVASLHLIGETRGALGLRYEAWQGALPPVYTSLLWKIVLTMTLLPPVLWLSWRLYKWPQSAWAKPRAWKGVGR